MREKQIERRNKSLSIMSNMGVDFHSSLPLLESSEQVKLKDLDTICRRAIASLIMTQLSCSITNGENYEECKAFIIELLTRFGVEGCLNNVEKSLLLPDYTEQNVIDVEWEYETFWALCWALGLIEREELDPPYQICDCEKAITLVATQPSFEAFKKSCKLRDIEDILDMLDLFYNYHWTCVEKRVNPNTNLGSLVPGIVMERRKGLEWLISEEDDWNEISLDT